MTKTERYGKDFSVETWLEKSRDALNAGEYPTATGHVVGAHELMRQSKALIAAHSQSLGELCRDISQGANKPLTGAADELPLMPTLYTNIYLSTVMREHLSDHLGLPNPVPLPEIWSDIVLSAATRLKDHNVRLSHCFAGLGYAHPLCRESDKSDLRQILLETLEPALQPEYGHDIGNMMWNSLNLLRFSGIFQSDPQLALAYNNALDQALKPEDSKNRMSYKSLLLLGMDSQTPEAIEIKTQLVALLAQASPKEAYHAVLISRILVDEQVEMQQALPDSPTRAWVNTTLSDSWATLCQKDPVNAHMGMWETKWGLPAPKPV